MSMNPHASHPDDQDPEEEWTEAETRREIPEPAITAEDTGPASMTQPQVPPPMDFPRGFQPAKTPPSPAARRPDRFWGCMVPIFGVGIVVLALVVLALFLPPFNLVDWIDEQVNGTEVPAADEQDAAASTALDFVDLTSDEPRIEVDGLVLAADPASLTDAYAVAVTQVSAADFAAGQVPAENWLCGAVLPTEAAQIAGPAYSFLQTGTPPDGLTLEIALADAAGADDVALYSWDASRRAWDFMPSELSDGDAPALVAQVSYLPRCVAAFRTTSVMRRAGVALHAGDTFVPGVVEAGAAVYPVGLRPTVSGTLQGVLAPGFETGRGYAVLPIIANYEDPAVVETEAVRAILQSPALRRTHVSQVAAFALGESAGYQGVVIDYRQLTADQRAGFTAFVRDLAGLLHAGDRQLVVVVPARPIDRAAEDGYDWAALGRHADALVIDMPLDPAAYVSGGWLDEMLAWAVTQVDRSRLRLGLAARSVEDQGQGVLVPVGFDEAWRYVNGVRVSPAGDVVPGETITADLVLPDGVTLEAGYDEALSTPYMTYTDADGQPLRRIWITDASALLHRLSWASEYELGGVMIRDLMAPGVLSGVSETVIAYLMGDLAPRPALDLAVDWQASAGEIVIAEQTLPPGEAFTFAAPSSDGMFDVAARVGDVLIGSAPVTVAAQPTPTPEPTPTATPEPAAGITGGDLPLPEVDPALAADLGDSFALGGHVSQLNARSILTVGRMKLAWLRVDVPFAMGADPEAARRVVEDAQANGFKILLTITGDRAELMNSEWAAYVDAYAAFAGGAAALGADAVEIWPGPNNAAYWPQGAIDPARYLQLLAYSYQAVKNVRPETVVISGGLIPAPLEAAGRQSETAWAADTYAAALAEAGAAPYADCIGVRYVEGAVNPTAVEGDPRGTDAAYYLPPVLDRVAAAFNGELPLCVTALGYLVPEGYSLPEGYEWAGSITAAQQAEWLAAARDYLSGRPDVRLMIIENIDFTTVVVGDVLGAYALIRPDESCPACERLTPQ